MINEKAFGKDHPSVAAALNNLASLLYATSRQAEAEPLYRRALMIDEKALGKDHPSVAAGLNNLAELHRATNRLEEAEPLYRRALMIAEKAFGKDHPSVATALNNLALLYQATDRLAEAESLMKRHLEIFINFTRKTGHPHSHLQGAIDNYGTLLMEMGDSQEEALGKLKQLVPEMFEVK